MIRRVGKIDDAGIFKSWKPQTSFPDFERINLIYGSNGSGKSTLARLLQNAAATDGVAAGIELLVQDRDGAPRQAGAGDAIWPSLRVFNRAYVESNLFFDDAGTTHTEPLLILGKDQIDQAKNLKQAESDLARTNGRLVELREAEKRNSDAQRDLSTATAKIIVEELQTLGGKYQGRRYVATQVHEAMRGDRTWDASKDVSADLGIVRSRSLPTLSVPKIWEHALSEIRSVVETLLAKTVVTAVIDALRENSVAATWVQQGLALHENSHDCYFCGGEITSARRQQVEGHFNQGVLELQSQIDRTKEDVANLRRSLAAEVSGLPGCTDLYEDQRDRYSEALQAFQASARIYDGQLNDLEQALNSKRDSLFTSASFAEQASPVELDVEPIAVVLREHNIRSNDFEQGVARAAERVEMRRLSDAIPEYDRCSSEISKAKAAISELERQREEARLEVERLSVQQFDPGPLAEEMTRDLAALLGRDELQFQLRNGRYSIERNGHPALTLSEGEKTAISLLYFLCSLRDASAEGQQLIVVIDDPVSSLDDEVLVGASSHMWNVLVAGGTRHQLFLLTHSFELFRLWCNQFERLPGGRSSDTKTIVAELRVTWKYDHDQAVVRSTRLIAWPGSQERKKLRSNYHYLFWRVGNTVIELRTQPDVLGEVEAATLIPNVARKLLEGFLAFRLPGRVGNLEKSVYDACQDARVSELTQRRLVRFLHHHSHNEEANLTRTVQTGEALAVLSSVFELINTLDPEHYERMADAVELSRSALIGSAED